MDYDNTDRGAIFRNDKKESEKHPDMTGSINVGGTEYYVSAWTKVSKKGAKFLSLSVKAKDSVAAPALKQAKQVIDNDFDDDDLPF